MAARRQTDPNERIVKELEAVKGLLALLLVKLGSDSAEIGKAVGQTGSSVRDWVSTRSVEKLDIPKVPRNKKKSRKTGRKTRQRRAAPRS